MKDTIPITAAALDRITDALIADGQIPASVDRCTFRKAFMEVLEKSSTHDFSLQDVLDHIALSAEASSASL